MKICVFGAGAIGGWLAARLSGAGADITCVARGAHFAAIQERGLIVRTDDAETRVDVRAVANAAQAGPQDYVIVALKAPCSREATEQIATLLGPETSVVTAQNGIPWWYFFRHGGQYENRVLSTVDPDGLQWTLIGPERAIGCVVYPATEIEAPGIIRHRYGERFSLGEPDGSKSPRVRRLAAALTAAGLRAPVRPDIRSEIWVKLLGNTSINPVSALTLATLDRIVTHARTRSVVRTMMAEASEVARSLGTELPIGIDQRIDGALEVGAHKSSMLQDLEKGRPLELTALTGAVLELAGICGVPCPTIEAVHALVSLRAGIP